MGWTDALRYITDYDEAIQYFDEMDGFHDYRIGHIVYKDGKNADIFIEEVIPGKKIPDNTGKVWECSFEDVKNFEISCDSAMHFYIGDIYGGETQGEVMFELTNGYIRILADRIIVRVPSDERKENT